MSNYWRKPDKMNLKTFFYKIKPAEVAAGYASVPGGKVTLYGTLYGLLTQSYLGQIDVLPQDTLDFILACQNEETGFFEGPELIENDTDDLHDQEHLLLHLACTALPALAQFGYQPRYPLRFAHAFCDIPYLKNWLNQRDLTKAWLEGNNLLFVGQLLVYLRDVEKHAGAVNALETWFLWLDKHVDPATGLWGSNGYCSAFEAMCGGYHQLLVYYYEQREVLYPEALVDTVLALQHFDGGFSPSGGGGACEDVDAVDILVNLYKINDYRRADIRYALRRCLKLIRSIQQPDGGFPYKLNQLQSHMGIPDTKAGKNVSTTFATWFRVHTLALIAEILTDDMELQKQAFRFNQQLSMGWHKSWDKSLQIIDKQSLAKEKSYRFRYYLHAIPNLLKGLWAKVWRKFSKILRK